MAEKGGLGGELEGDGGKGRAIVNNLVPPLETSAVDTHTFQHNFF